MADLNERFRQLVDRSYEPLLSYATYLVRSPAEAEDVVHQVFLLAFERMADGEAFTGDPAAWLRGTARNLVGLIWRERRRLSADAARALLELADQTDDAVARALETEATEALGRCLGKLGDDERRLVSDRYQRGLPITRIADDLSQNVATVRVRLFRIRSALKACVKRQFDARVPA